MPNYGSINARITPNHPLYFVDYPTYLRTETVNKELNRQLDNFVKELSRQDKMTMRANGKFHYENYTTLEFDIHNDKEQQGLSFVNIMTAKAFRRQNRANQALKVVTDVLDRLGLTIFLCPEPFIIDSLGNPQWIDEPSQDTENMPGEICLRKLYSKHGFRNCSSKTDTDIKASFRMVRRPVLDPLERL
jgi:hypothetical protein